VNPYELAFAKRVPRRAAPLLARAEEFKTLAEAVADCTLVVGTTAVGSVNCSNPVRRLEQAAPLIRKRLAASPVALLFGSEKRGLSNERPQTTAIGCPQNPHPRGASVHETSARP